MHCFDVSYNALGWYEYQDSIGIEIVMVCQNSTDVKIAPVSRWYGYQNSTGIKIRSTDIVIYILFLLKRMHVD